MFGPPVNDDRHDLAAHVARRQRHLVGHDLRLGRRTSRCERLRDPDRFDRVVQACPLQAHWLQGQPITDVLPMAGVLDRYRRFVVDGRPVVTGVAAVGDAWACTNPSAGRGISLGLLHAQQLRSVVATHLDDPAAFAVAWHEAGEREVGPYFWAQIDADRRRLARDRVAPRRQPSRPHPTRWSGRSWRP